MTINGGVFSNNVAGSGGGAIANQGEGQLTLNGVSITNNSAGNGGALLMSGAVMNIVNSTNNSADQHGGGIDISISSVLYALNGTVINNNTTTVFGGGGIHMEDAYVTLDPTVQIQGNTAGQPGGGVYLKGNSVLTLGGATVGNQINNNTPDNRPYTDLIAKGDRVTG